jgi:hypothetical protein
MAVNSDKIYIVKEDDDYTHGAQNIYAIYYDLESMDNFMKENRNNEKYTAYTYSRNANGILHEVESFSYYLMDLEEKRKQSEVDKEEGIKKSYNYINNNK